eukprot:scaffold7387_cov408-Prasinococcus_capsulatus_cf.AAC.3
MLAWATRCPLHHKHTYRVHNHVNNAKGKDEGSSVIGTFSQQVFDHKMEHMRYSLAKLRSCYSCERRADNYAGVWVAIMGLEIG